MHATLEKELSSVPPPNTVLSANRPAFDLQVVEDPAELDACAAEWSTLWERSQNTPFQSPAWLIPCAHFVGERLKFLIWRSQGEIVGLAPLSMLSDPVTRGKKLLFLGTGISDYLDIISTRHHQKAITAALLDWLHEHHHEWDRCELRQLPQHSSLLELASPSPGSPCPILSLQGRSIHNYAPPKHLEKLNYYRRRAAKFGNLEFVTATESTCEPLMRALFQLHQNRWESRGDTGVLCGSSIQQFHLAVAARMAHAGMLRLHAAKLDGQIIAVLYGFSSHQQTFYYLAGFDSAFEKLSPGTLIVGHAIEHALREGHRSFDFLRGQEPYKYAWGAHDQPTFDLCFPPT